VPDRGRADDGQERQGATLGAAERPETTR
jgi:hypothetical protein